MIKEASILIDMRERARLPDGRGPWTKKISLIGREHMEGSEVIEDPPAMIIGVRWTEAGILASAKRVAETGMT